MDGWMDGIEKGSWERDDVRRLFVFIFHSASLLALLVSPLSSSKIFFSEMPSKKNTRKQRENKTAQDDVDWPAFIA